MKNIIQDILIGKQNEYHRLYNSLYKCNDNRKLISKTNAARLAFDKNLRSVRMAVAGFSGARPLFPLNLNHGCVHQVFVKLSRDEQVLQKHINRRMLQYYKMYGTMPKHVNDVFDVKDTLLKRLVRKALKTHKQPILVYKTRAKKTSAAAVTAKPKAKKNLIRLTGLKGISDKVIVLILPPDMVKDELKKLSVA